MKDKKRSTNEKGIEEEEEDDDEGKGYVSYSGWIAASVDLTSFTAARVGEVLRSIEDMGTLRLRRVSDSLERWTLMNGEGESENSDGGKEEKESEGAGGVNSQEP